VVSATNHPNAAAPKATPRASATTPAQTPQQKFLAWYNATGQHDVLTLTRDTSTVTADENSGDTAALQRDGTTLRNDSIAAIAHPNPPIDPADWGNAMTASMLGAGLGAVMGKLTTTGLGSAFQD
jgi:hypothetical protein